LDKEVKALADYVIRVLSLDEAKLSDEYFYQNLSLCVIDSIYSIGVRYAGVQAVVDRYCRKFELKKVRDDRTNFPVSNEQESISEFCKRIEMCPNELALTLFQNRQRTSAKSGILKAEAVQQFARILHSYEIENFQDVAQISSKASFEKSIQNIRGQRSGISLKYFWMLAGAENFIKPDRMVIRFVETALNRSIPPTAKNIVEVERLLREVCEHIKTETKYSNLTPRLLDHEVWKYQRVSSKNSFSK